MSWRVLTLKQPEPWSLMHAGRDVVNQPWPIPQKLLGDVPTEISKCFAAHCEAETLNGEREGWGIGLDDTGEGQYVCPEHFGYVFSDETDQALKLDQGWPQLRVMVHSAAAWDKRYKFCSESWTGQGVKTTVAPAFWGFSNREFFKFPGGDVVDGQDRPVTFSAVVAVAVLTRSHTSIVCSKLDPTGECSTWAEPGTTESPMHHWHVTDVRPLATPVPAKGRSNRLWKPNVELVEAVEAQL